MTRTVDILTPLGALYYNTGRYEEALQIYREAVSLQPDSTDTWLALVMRTESWNQCGNKLPHPKPCVSFSF